MARTFRVAWTADLFAAGGKPQFRDIGWRVLADDPAVDCRVFDRHLPEITPEQIGDAQGVVVLGPKVTAASLAHSERLLGLARFGVGFDSVDVAACTAADVVLCTTVGAVDRSMAEATVALVLGITHRLREKDLLVRQARWNERPTHMGCELRDRTLGVVGLGGIGRAVVRLLSGFGMCPPIAFDPLLDPARAAELGVRLVPLDELLAQADFVSIHCPLNEQTRNLIGRAQLRRMKPSAFLINTARGGIVDEGALYEALAEGRIAGAAIDCFAGEPLAAPPKLAELDNVLLTPHAAAWTDELFRDIGTMAAQALADLAHGKVPHYVVNREVLDKPSFRAKWEALRVEGAD